MVISYLQIRDENVHLCGRHTGQLPNPYPTLAEYRKGFPSNNAYATVGEQSF